jgi:hypothetical protein
MQGVNDTKQKRETRALTGMLKSLSYLHRLCPHRRLVGLAYTGLSLGKKSRLRGRILRVAKVAQADANQAKPLVRAEADTF